MTTSAPSSSPAQSPRVTPSQRTERQGESPGLRLKTTTSCPSARNARARMDSTCPEPPGMMIFINGSACTNVRKGKRAPTQIFRISERQDRAGQPRIDLRSRWRRSGTECENAERRSAAQPGLLSPASGLSEHFTPPFPLRVRTTALAMRSKGEILPSEGLRIRTTAQKDRSSAETLRNEDLRARSFAPAGETFLQKAGTFPLKEGMFLQREETFLQNMRCFAFGVRRSAEIHPSIAPEAPRFAPRVRPFAYDCGRSHSERKRSYRLCDRLLTP